jgi:tRNA(Ile)-lysidine synthase
VGDGLEAAAREDRYRLLVDMAEAVGARYVVTAHTRDDQAETVLFRLLRGSGLRGLAGMRPSRPLSPTVALVRPLLDCTRVDLRGYLESLGQSWREDRTNDDVKHARNRLRHEALPYLREHFNAEADAVIVRSAALLGEVNSLVERLAAELLAHCGQSSGAGGSGDGVTLSVAPLAAQPQLLVAEALRQVWRSGGWPEQAMTHAWWRRLAQLALSTDAGTLNLPGNVLARRQGDLLMLAPAGPSA